MRLVRLSAAATVLMICAAAPAWSQQPAPAEDADTDAPADVRTPVEGKTAKPARKPAPRAVAPVKPASPARVETPSQPELTPGGRSPITEAEVRPPADMLIDCAKAPNGAVTKVPNDLARWATVYCTKLGHIFNSNDHFFGAFPDTGVRASFSAADMMGKSGEAGNDAYFSAIAYRQLSKAEADALIALDPSVRRVLVDKALWRLDLTAANGSKLSFLAVDPLNEFFWVFPLSQRGIDTPAFYVSSLAALNKAR